MVRARVEEARLQAAASGDQVASKIGHLVTRKTVKRPVMTIVYGVTHYGAVRQIYDELKNTPLVEGMDKDDVKAACVWLAGAIFDAVAQSFSQSRSLKDWFVRATDLITGVHLRATVEWRTPLGLPVVQPYVQERKVRIPSTSLDTQNEETIAQVDMPLGYKQKQAMPPNYIHSLDGTHMMLTGLHCQRRGVVFASVHDCYWTHAATVSLMNRICREQFVALHRRPLLEDLRDFFHEKYVKSAR